MRKVGDIMADLGFNPEAPESTQKAFVKNLVREAYGAEVRELKDYRKTKNQELKQNQRIKKAAVGSDLQMSFDFDSDS